MTSGRWWTSKCQILIPPQKHQINKNMYTRIAVLNSRNHLRSCSNQKNAQNSWKRHDILPLSCLLPSAVWPTRSEGSYPIPSYSLGMEGKEWNSLLTFKLTWWLNKGLISVSRAFEHWWECRQGLDSRLKAAESGGEHHGMLEMQEVCRLQCSCGQEVIQTVYNEIEGLLRSSRLRPLGKLRHLKVVTYTGNRNKSTYTGPGSAHFPKRFEKTLSL